MRRAIVSAAHCFPSPRLSSDVEYYFHGERLFGFHLHLHLDDPARIDSELDAVASLVRAMRER